MSQEYVSFIVKPLLNIFTSMCDVMSVKRSECTVQQAYFSKVVGTYDIEVVFHLLQFLI